MELPMEKSEVCVVRCKGGKEEVGLLFEYQGPDDCRTKNILHQGDKRCIFGCLGNGHCMTVCPSGAITMSANDLQVIDANKCVACRTCVKECPRHVLELVPRTQLIYLACMSPDKDNMVRDACTVGCDACGMCVKVCTSGDNIGEPCINNNHCPNGACAAAGTCRDRCGRCAGPLP